MTKQNFLKMSMTMIFIISSLFTDVQGQQANDWITGIELPGVTISEVVYVPAGNYTPPGYRDAMTNLPAFVRVALTSRPVPESNIRIEVWMPEKDWNGRFVGIGNGGGGGQISYGALVSGVRCGFAVANTDMGTSPHVDSLIYSPQKWEDFGFRATHEMTVIAKAVIKEYYKKNPIYTYFVGCSTGGQQALMEAQRYPDDYNGILAGAPANNRTHLHSLFLWNYKAVSDNPGNSFTREQVQSITNAVLALNVGKDGGYSGDSFLTDPRMATFDTSVLDTCLTPTQVKILGKILSGPVNPVTGEQIYTPFPLGSESAGSGLYEQQGDPICYHLYPFRWVYGLDFDFRKFDFDKEMEQVDAILASILNANNPDLEPFRKSGGKLLMYTGTSDPLVPFQDAVHYYEQVVEAQGSMEKTQTFFRYFLVPGMYHCDGGPGPCNIGQSISDLSQDSEYNIFTALIKWVEEGFAPERITGTAYQNGTISFRRPVFPYPKFPHYIEGTNPDLPSSYRGIEHESGKVKTPATKYFK
jgi:feruloyl esterase